MRTTTLLKSITLVGALILTGCTKKIELPNQYSGFLHNYDNLKETTSISGKPELRWVASDYDPLNYDNIVYTPVVYYPAPQPNSQIGQTVLDQIITYTNAQLQKAFAEKKELVETPGPRSLIFRGAITGVSTSEEGLQFYDIIPAALIVAGTQMATGHRTMDSTLYFEGELIDAKTNQPVITVVRKSEGKTLSNEATPVTIDTLKQVIDEIAIDAVKFDITKAKIQ